MATSEITSLADCGMHRVCPRCGHHVLRGADPEDVETTDGTTLWTLVEWCIMCKWSRTLRHVKAGY